MFSNVSRPRPQLLPRKLGPRFVHYHLAIPGWGPTCCSVFIRFNTNSEHQYPINRYFGIAPNIGSLLPDLIRAGIQIIIFLHCLDIYDVLPLGPLLFQVAARLAVLADGLQVTG